MTLLWIPICIAIFLTGLSIMLLAIDTHHRHDNEEVTTYPEEKDPLA